MTLVFFTSESSLSNHFTRYYLQELKRTFPDLLIFSVKEKELISIKNKLKTILKLVKRKWNMWKWYYFLEYFFSYTIKLKFSSFESQKIDKLFEKKISMNVEEIFKNRILVESINGVKTINELKRYSPDIIIQAGAGLLKQGVIDIPRLGIINIHHGIAPLIKGMDSIYWAKWGNNESWLGATIHYIDAGIDTGRVIKYIYPLRTNLNNSFSDIFYELSVDAIDNLIIFLVKNKVHESNNIILDNVKTGTYNYRSSISGFRMLILAIRNQFKSEIRILDK